MLFTSVRKRDGQVIPFDQTRITNAILKAFAVTQEGNGEDAEKVSEKVMKELTRTYPADGALDIEDIQDIIETQLILLDYPKTAKAYILYRQERALLREKRKQIPDRVKELARESKRYFRNSLGEFIYYRSYSRWIEEEGRRETWIETVDRYMNYMKKNIGDALAGDEYAEVREAILRQEALPSMRLFWSAGTAADWTHVMAYNCSYIAPTKPQDLAEIMYLSMCGAGVGFSVEQQTVQQFPQIRKQTGKKLPPHAIVDSKEGWADALSMGIKTWFDGKDIDFDFSKLRPQGARLKTMGGRSSGPDPLRAVLEFSRRKLLSKQGRRLTPIDLHDIICKIGEVVVMGGVRRTALISLSDLDDVEMRHAKTGQFYLTEPQRSMANNSAVYNEKPTASQFLDEWIALSKSGTGERGIFNRGGLKTQIPERRWKIFKDYAATAGSNPCLTGGTLVYVADGRGNVSMKQLVDEGKDVPVFCRTSRGGITVRYMRNPRLTGKSKQVYKITLDDGSVIRTTANHKFLLTSGEYKEAKDFVYGDSLSILTRFAASIKDVFHDANSRSQDYWWINNGRGNNVGEHRLIAGFHYNTKIPKGYIVHHRDRNAQNNFPENLKILSKEDHDALHAHLMVGDCNPMRRAKKEWDEQKWNEYHKHMSDAVSGSNNGRCLGITHNELKEHALTLTRMLGRRFSNGDWNVYARERRLPQHFSKWRRDHLGGVLGLAKWAAFELGIDHADIDPRVAWSYRRRTREGYNCEIKNGRVIIKKNCEVCGMSFEMDSARREYGVCGIACGLKKVWANSEFKEAFRQKIREAHQRRKKTIRETQAKMYGDIKFQLGREPFKIEWAQACREKGISEEISRTSSPFRSYKDLKNYASMYNHKVVAIEFDGYEDVYNGTVDEFHNFFVGGFESFTRNRKKKIVYLNNLQCGEIILRSKSFCNLSEVVCRSEDTEETLLKKVKIATILGTYQSTLTNFPYLSKEWKKNCEEERLLGVSLTGQWDAPLVRDASILKKIKEYALEINKTYAKKMGINPSVSITCVKPSGTVSQLVDAASGLHPRHAPYYLRRVRIAATDGLFRMLKDQKIPHYPEIGQMGNNITTYVLEFPVKAPAGSVFRNDLTAVEQLEHWKIVKENFTEHNPSVTISVGENEWIAVAHWLYEHWDMLGGLSFLPREDHVYALAPFEEITNERYEQLAKEFPDIDFSQILLYEKDDETIGSKELACVGGTCEIL